MSPVRWPRLPDVVVTVLLTALVLAPLLAPGFVLVGDMVFVPDQPWKDAWTGGDGGVPRAVPSDAWVALLDDVLPGQVLQKLVLVGIALGAGLGISLLLRELPTVARVAGIVLYLWNPYVYERLAIGHWALLVGYAALPWVASGALRLRDGPSPRGWALLACGLALAGWSSPTGGVLTVMTALVVVLAPGTWRRGLGVLLLGAWVNLPWLVPALLNGSDQLSPDGFGTSAFASRADTPWGVIASLGTFGGIWKESIVPADRGNVLMSGVALLVMVAAVAGLVLRRRTPVLPVTAAVLLSVLPLTLSGLSAFDATRPLAEWIVVEVPGGGLLRDAQKLLMPWVLVAATGFASLVAELVPRLRGFGGHARLWLAVVALFPLLALPSLAAGLNGFLQPTDYPAEWESMRAEMERLGVEDDRMVVLPFATYRRFDWTPRTILDPAPRFFPGQLITDDALVVRDGTVGGESTFAAEIRDADTPEVLAEVLAGGRVGWALVHETGEPALLPSSAQVVVSGSQLSLHRLQSGGVLVEESSPTRSWVYAWMDALVLLGTAVFAGLSRWRS